MPPQGPTPRWSQARSQTVRLRSHASVPQSPPPPRPCRAPCSPLPGWRARSDVAMAVESTCGCPPGGRHHVVARRRGVGGSAQNCREAPG